MSNGTPHVARVRRYATRTAEIKTVAQALFPRLQPKYRGTAPLHLTAAGSCVASTNNDAFRRGCSLLRRKCLIPLFLILAGGYRYYTAGTGMRPARIEVKPNNNIRATVIARTDEKTRSTTHSDERYANKNYYTFQTQPRALLFNECEGSTATSKWIRKILEAHGLSIQSSGEALKPQNNPRFLNLIQQKYDNKTRNKIKMMGNRDFPLGQAIVSNETIWDYYTTNMMEALVDASLENSDNNTTLWFKADRKKIEMNNLELIELMKQNNFAMTEIYRNNTLDTCVCNVRDCFWWGRVGYPVFADDGKKTNFRPCFDRRKQNRKVKAYFDDSTYSIVDCVRSLKEETEHAASRGGISTEDLFSFEYTNDQQAFENSIQVWKKLVEPLLGRHLNERTIRTTLRVIQNTRSAPGPHSEVIQNMDWVEEKLREANLDSFVRH